MPEITKFRLLLAAYLTGAVLCFGPAVVQGEDDAELEYMTCQSISRYPDNCVKYPLYRADGFAKALAWPFWLSYMAATGGFKELP